MNLIFIAIGGGAGAVLRYLSIKLTNTIFEAQFPLGVLFVNIIGSFLIGLLFSAFKIVKVPLAIEYFLIAGFLGGYTTFSTYSLETIVLISNGKLFSGLLNILLNNVLCLVFAALGIWIGKLFIKIPC